MGLLDLKQETSPPTLGLGEEFARPIPIRNPIVFDRVILAAAGQTNWPRLQRASAASSGRTLWPWRRKCQGPMQVVPSLGSLASPCD
jgi:hypothetical protein